jgi:hypothetical protein
MPLPCAAQLLSWRMFLPDREAGISSTQFSEFLGKNFGQGHNSNRAM